MKINNSGVDQATVKAYQAKLKDTNEKLVTSEKNNLELKTQLKKVSDTANKQIDELKAKLKTKSEASDKAITTQTKQLEEAQINNDSRIKSLKNEVKQLSSSQVEKSSPLVVKTDFKELSQFANTDDFSPDHRKEAMKHFENDEVPSPLKRGADPKSPYLTTNDPLKLKEDNARLMVKLRDEHEKYSDLKQKYEQLDGTYSTLKQFLENKGSKVNIKKNVVKNPAAKKNAVVRRLVAGLYNMLPQGMAIFKEHQIKAVHVQEIDKVKAEELKKLRVMIIKRLTDSTFNKKFVYYQTAERYYQSSKLKNAKQSHILKRMQDTNFNLKIMAFLKFKDWYACIEQKRKEKMGQVVRCMKDKNFKLINMAYFGLKDKKWIKNYKKTKEELDTRINLLEAVYNEEKHYNTKILENLQSLFDESEEDLTKENIVKKMDGLKARLDQLETDVKEEKEYNHKLVNNLSNIFGNVAQNISKLNVDSKMKVIKQMIDKDKNRVEIALKQVEKAEELGKQKEEELKEVQEKAATAERCQNEVTGMQSSLSELNSQKLLDYQFLKIEINKISEKLLKEKKQQGKEIDQAFSSNLPSSIKRSSRNQDLTEVLKNIENLKNKINVGNTKTDQQNANSTGNKLANDESTLNIDVKIPHGFEMDGIVPWFGWCTDKDKKFAMNFTNLVIEDGKITGSGEDHVAPFTVEGKLEYYTNKKTKIQFPQVNFNKQYSSGTNTCKCTGIIDNGVIKGNFICENNDSFGDFEITTDDPDWLEIERKFNKNVDDRLKVEKEEWLKKNPSKKIPEKQNSIKSSNILKLDSNGVDAQQKMVDELNLSILELQRSIIFIEEKYENQIESMNDKTKSSEEKLLNSAHAVNKKFVEDKKQNDDEIEKLNKQISDQQIKIKQLNDKLSETDKKLADANKSIENKSIKLLEVTQQNKVSESKIAEKIAEFENNKAELENATSSLNELTSKKINLESSMIETANENNIKERKMISLSKKLKDSTVFHSNEIKDQNDKIEKLIQEVMITNESLRNKGKTPQQKTQTVVPAKSVTNTQSTSLAQSQVVSTTDNKAAVQRQNTTGTQPNANKQVATNVQGQKVVQAQPNVAAGLIKNVTQQPNQAQKVVSQKQLPVQTQKQPVQPTIAAGILKNVVQPSKSQQNGPNTILAQQKPVQNPQAAPTQVQKVNNPQQNSANLKTSNSLLTSQQPSNRSIQDLNSQLINPPTKAESVTNSQKNIQTNFDLDLTMAPIDKLQQAVGFLKTILSVEREKDLDLNKLLDKLKAEKTQLLKNVKKEQDALKEVKSIKDKVDSELTKEKQDNKKLNIEKTEQGTQIKDTVALMEKEMKATLEKNDKVVKDLKVTNEKELKSTTDEKNKIIEDLKKLKEQELNATNEQKEKAIKELKAINEKELKTTTNEKDKIIEELKKSKEEDLKKTIDEKNKAIEDLTKSKEADLKKTNDEKNKAMEDLKKSKEAELQKTINEKTKIIEDLTKSKLEDLKKTTDEKNLVIEDLKKSKVEELKKTTDEKNLVIEDLKKTNNDKNNDLEDLKCKKETVDEQNEFLKKKLEFSKSQNYELAKEKNEISKEAKVQEGLMSELRRSGAYKTYVEIAFDKKNEYFEIMPIKREGVEKNLFALKSKASVGDLTNVLHSWIMDNLYVTEETYQESLNKIKKGTAAADNIKNDKLITNTDIKQSAPSPLGKTISENQLIGMYDIFTSDSKGKIRKWSAGEDCVAHAYKDKKFNDAISCMGLALNQKYIYVACNTDKMILFSTQTETIVGTRKTNAVVNKIIVANDPDFFYTLNAKNQLTKISSKRFCKIGVILEDYQISGVCPTKDNDYLIIGTVDGQIHQYSIDYDTVEKTQEVKHNSAIKNIKLSKDGKMLFTQDVNFNVKIFDVEAEFKLHKEQPSDFASGEKFVNPEGDMIYSVDNDGVLHQWDVEGLTKVHSFGKMAKGISCIEFSPDNLYFFVGTSEGYMRQFSTHEKKLVLNWGQLHQDKLNSICIVPR